MKRIHIQGFGMQGTDAGKLGPEENGFFDQQTQKQLELAKKLISTKYSPAGIPEESEFRTTMELQYEFREMVRLFESTINDAMNELGFQVEFLDGKPNWVLYLNKELKK
jgi:hypothetical protein